MTVATIEQLPSKQLHRDFDFEDRPLQRGQHVARAADITLANANEFSLELDGPDFDFDLGVGDGIGSQDFDVDLGIDFGDGPVDDTADKTGAADETMSVEVGRDAASIRSPRASLVSHLLGKDGDDALTHRSREMSENPFGADMDLDFGPDVNGMDIDLGLDLGDGLGDLSMGDGLLGENGKAKSLSRACMLFAIIDHIVLLMPKKLLPSHLCRERPHPKSRPEQ